MGIPGGSRAEVGSQGHMLWFWLVSPANPLQSQLRPLGHKEGNSDGGDAWQPGNNALSFLLPCLWHPLRPTWRGIGWLTCTPSIQGERINLGRLQYSDSQNQALCPHWAERHHVSSVLVSVLERRISMGLSPFPSIHTCVGISCGCKRTSCIFNLKKALLMFTCVEISKESSPSVAEKATEIKLVWANFFSYSMFAWNHQKFTEQC